MQLHFSKRSLADRAFFEIWNVQKIRLIEDIEDIEDTDYSQTWPQLVGNTPNQIEMLIEKYL